MRVRAAAAAALALALAAGTALQGQASGAPAASTSADCVPVKHSKRVVKRVKVKRKGRIVKVKRKKTVKWETCEEQPAAPASPAAPPPSTPCAEPSSNLGVTARDDAPMGARYSLSRGCVTAGEVVVQLQNQGMDPHNLQLRRVDSGSAMPFYSLPGTSPAAIDPLQNSAATAFNLTPGDWYLWCDLLNHEAEGMRATLAVR